MNAKFLFSTLAAASLALTALPAIADDGDDDGSSSSSSSSSFSSSSSSSIDATRVERCKRFSRGDDYERCVRLIRRLPAKENVETVDTTDTSSDEWKWTNIFTRLEDKVRGSLKYVGVMSKKFCKDRTAENTSTSRECMARIKAELKVRIDSILDEVFRADLPSAR